MTRSLHTLALAGALAVAGLVTTADRAAAQYPYAYPGVYYSGYTPFGTNYGYTTTYSTGYATPFFPGGYYSTGYQTGFYSAPAFGYGFYPMAPSNIWTGSYYISPATYWRLRGRW